jgi:hypothetical protein
MDCSSGNARLQLEMHGFQSERVARSLIDDKEWFLTVG